MSEQLMTVAVQDHDATTVVTVAAELSIDDRPYGTTLRIRSQPGPVR